MPSTIAIDQERLVDVCRRHHVAKLELFGSRAQGTARPDSDVDLLVTFAPGQTPSLFAPDGYMAFLLELEAVFGHPVDLLTRAAIESDPNEYFRRQVLDHIEVLYAA